MTRRSVSNMLTAFLLAFDIGIANAITVVECGRPTDLRLDRIVGVSE